MANNLYIPELNPILLFEVDRSNIGAYFTKHFEKYPFAERLYDWQQPEDYVQVWQTTDIIYMQFESTFDPIIVELVDEEGASVITLPALIGLPNKFLENTYSFEVSMSLGSVTTGCYKLKVTAGSGETQKIFLSGCQYISETQLENTILFEYWNSRFHKDVVFETGIQFQKRIPGHFGFLDKQRKDEVYRDERYNPTLLGSKSSKQWTIYHGDEYGLPDDEINFIDEMWSCDNVLVDGKPFGIADGGKLEYITIEDYPKRGLSLKIEEGINRNSRLYELGTDTTKKLATTIIVDAAVFGDTSNQGSSNTVPVFNIQGE